MLEKMAAETAASEARTGEPMRIRAVLRGNLVEVRVLMTHIMETGYRKDSNGVPVPAHFIRHVTATHNGREVLAAQWGPAISRDPYLEFRFADGAKGDKVRITWVDNLGYRRSDEVDVV
jgi:sulfur-oxidizing protein SoxZ